MTDRVDISRLLVEMRSIKSQAQAFQGQGLAAKDISPTGMGPNGIGQSSQVKPTGETASFGDLLEQAVDKVNSIQKPSSATSQAYERGDPNVDITDVMIAREKSSVAFQSALQVRNKLIEAYRDVMNMPV